MIEEKKQNNEIQAQIDGAPPFPQILADKLPKIAPPVFAQPDAPMVPPRPSGDVVAKYEAPVMEERKAAEGSESEYEEEKELVVPDFPA